MTNNLSQTKQLKCSTGISSLLTKQTPFKKQLPLKSNMENFQQGVVTKNKASSLIEFKHSSKLNSSKNERIIIDTNKDRIVKQNFDKTEESTTINKGKASTKYVQNPLLNQLVKNNSQKIEMSSLSNEKRDENNNLSYTKFAIKKNETTIKNDNKQIEIYTRFGTQTNYSKYKNLSKVKNSSMIEDTNNLLDSDTYLGMFNNSTLLNKNNKTNLSEDIKLKLSTKRKNNATAFSQGLDEVIEEKNGLKNLDKRNLKEIMVDRLKSGLNLSFNSLLDNQRNEDDISLGTYNCTNNESLKKGKLGTDNNCLLLKVSNSFLDDSISILNKASTKCQTARIIELTNIITPFNHSNTYNQNIKFENKFPDVSEPFEINENKKSKISTKDDSIKSYSNRFEIDTIEEQHYMFVRFLHSTRKMIKSQEENIKTMKFSSLNHTQQVNQIEEIDLE